MEKVHHNSIVTLIQQIHSFLEENSVSHFLFVQAIVRMIQGDEELLNGYVILDGLTKYTIYIKSNHGQYFFGNNETLESCRLLAEEVPTKDLKEDKMIFGNKTIIETIFSIKGFYIPCAKRRHYYSLVETPGTRNKSKPKLYMAIHEDYERLSPLAIKFYNEEFEGSGAKSENEVLTVLKNNIESGEVYYWEEKGLVTTVITLSQLPNNRFFIPSIFTLREFRAQGISRSAMTSLISHLFRQGCVEVGLMVNPSNEPAIRLFKSLGMSLVYETGIYTDLESTQVPSEVES